jgi:hypothetical protein
VLGQDQVGLARPGVVVSHPSGLSVSTRTLITLTTALQRSRNQLGTRWRRLAVGDQALLALAHLRKGETYATSPPGSGSAPLPHFATSAKPSTPSPRPPPSWNRRAGSRCARHS